MHKLQILLLAILISSCATEYQELDGTGSGFYENMKSDSAYTIGFKGNEFTSYEATKDFAIMRAAEIATKLDYSYFAVTGKKDASETKVQDLGSTTYEEGKVKDKNGKLKYKGSTETYNNVVETKYPGVELEVQYFRAKPEKKYLELYEAESILRELQAKHAKE